MPVETEQSGCESLHCCKDEAGGEEKGAPEGKMKKDGSCCISNVLSVEQEQQFTYHQVHALQLKTGFLEDMHINLFTADFWQPPRAV